MSILDTESDRDVLEQVAMADGGEVEVAELETSTPWATSTIYRVLKRLDDLLACDNGNVKFLSQKIREKVRDVIVRIDDVVESGALVLERLLNVDRRDLERKGHAFQQWLNEYAAELVDDGSGNLAPSDRPKIRIRTLLSELKGSSEPFAPEVVNYGYIAWDKAGRDTAAFRRALVEFETRDGTIVRRVDDLLGLLKTFH